MADTTVQLKVAEANPRDVGRGLARVDPEVMAQMGIDASGEIVSLKGKRETVAKIMPTFPELRGRGIVQIDDITRENAQVGIDEQVKLAKIKVAEARRITLSPLTLIDRMATDRAYLSRQLSAIPVTRGDRVQTTFLGTKKQDFRVVDTFPPGAVLVIPQATITVTGEGKATEARLTYEDIGGLCGQGEGILGVIELPLPFSDGFFRFGVCSPKRGFFHGPPGFGKTPSVQAIATST